MKTKISINRLAPAFASVLLAVVLLCGGCNIRQDAGEDLHKANEEECDVIKAKLTYIKDEKTGLCFAVLNNHTDGFRSTFAIACVPCDSLKAVGVK